MPAVVCSWLIGSNFEQRLFIMASTMGLEKTTTLDSIPKRHWVTTLLAVWMFADAVLMLFWEAIQLYSVWGFHHRTGTPHPTIALPWPYVIFDYLRGLLNLFPAPHLLLAVPEIVFYKLMHLPRTSSLLRDSLLTVTVAAIAVAIGYGLLLAREWARWSYAALCILSVVLTVFFGWAGSMHLIAFVYGLIGGFVLPIVLLVFLFRRGLIVQPRRGSSSVNRGGASA